MTVMLVTTCLTSLVIILCWHKPLLLALAFLLFFGFVELLYFSASLTKFCEGAWLPILLALFLMTVMFVWHYAAIKKYEYDLHNKVSLEWLLALGPSLGIARVPGIGLVYTDLISGIPANFSRFVTNLPAFHRVLIFVCVKSVPVPYVPPAERYLVGRVGPPDHRSYRCIVRYGYRDVHQDIVSFESELVARLADFIRLDGSLSGCNGSKYSIDGSQSGDSANEGALTVIGTAFLHLPAYDIDENAVPASVSIGFQTVESVGDMIEMEPVGAGAPRTRVRLMLDDNNLDGDAHVRAELEELWAAQNSGTAFILGHSHMKAKQGSCIFKRLAIDLGYNFLRRNCRGPEVALKVPAASLLEVGMVYVV